MRSLLLLAVALLGCSDDPAGTPAGVAPGFSSGGSSGAPSGQAGVSGAPVVAGGQGGDAGQAQAGAAGAPVVTAGAGGAADQEAGGGGEGGHADACVPGEQASCPCPGVKAGTKSCLSDGSGYGSCECPMVQVPECKAEGVCLDSRVLYTCANDLPPNQDTCIRNHKNGAWCCGTPTSAICKPGHEAGASRADAVLLTEQFYTLPASGDGWLKGKPVTKTYKVEGEVGAYPLAGGSVDACVGGYCDDGVLGTVSCQEGTLTPVGGANLCCIKGDYVTGGKTPKATIGCNAGSVTPYLFVRELSGQCRDLSPAVINGI